MFKFLSLLFVCIGIIGCNPINKEKETIANNALFSVKEYGKWGFINVNGEKKIECQYDKVNEFTEGLAAVKVDSLWGYINSTNHFVIKPQFSYAKPFSSGLAKVAIDRDSTYTWEYINRQGEIPFSVNFKSQGEFNNDLAKVIVDGRVCFMDTTGEIVIRTGYPYGTAFKEGFTHVWTGDSTKYIDSKGKVLLHVAGMGNNNFSEGLAQVKINNQHDYINKKGIPIMNGLQDNYVYHDFNSGLAQITRPGMNHKSGFIDKLGNIVIPIVYSNVSDFHEGFAAYRDTVSYGFINTKGDTVINPQFTSVDYEGFQNGLCKVSFKDEWGYVNYSGYFVWKSELLDNRYGTLDLSKWHLDTLELNEPLDGGLYSRFKAMPIQKYSNNKSFYIKLDTTKLTVYQDRYYGYKVNVVNETENNINVSAQDGRIKLIHQALNKNGDWRDIENFINSFCGNSYHTIEFKPQTYRTYIAPVLKGDFNTKLRYKLENRDTIIFSNTYYGSINKTQFLMEEEKDKTGITVWTN